MVTSMKRREKKSMLGKFSIILCCFLVMNCSTKVHAASWFSWSSHKSSTPPVKLRNLDKHVEIDNGIAKLTLTKPSGMVASLSYKGVDNLMESRLKETRRGYWDIMWSRPDKGGSHFDTLPAERFRVIDETEDQVEVSFMKSWKSSIDNDPPLNIDKRYIMRRGSSGFYAYAIFEHEQGWPALHIDELRIAFKLDHKMFHYMAIADDKQRIMPTEQDRESGHRLQYAEATLLTNPENPVLKGEVDDKYQYSLEGKDNRVHGWASTDKNIGFWVITPSDEFRAGGPTKPDLTSHVGPTSLAMFLSGHYSGPSFAVRLDDGEPWKKVFGPVFVYLNSGSENSSPRSLWDDAKRQMSEEIKKWPYDFPMSEDFPHPNERGSITGRLIIRDDKKLIPAKSAYIGLATPGVAGSWQDEVKGYQFWSQTDENGYFTITGVISNTYNLYAWAPKILGDFKHYANITIRPGNEAHIGNIVFDPPRNGPTLWEIGVPDRTAAEFYIPDPDPNLANKLYINHTDKFRQYGLWERYSELYPTEDLVYTVGSSDYSKDWFFAHVTRHKNGYYTPTTWQVRFDLENVEQRGTYTLRLTLASASFAELQVRINDQNSRFPHFTTRLIGRDNAIARHGIHGRYLYYSVDITGSQLVNGVNTIYLRQARATGPFNGVMYDYIRLEGPPRDRN